MKKILFTLFILATTHTLFAQVNFENLPLMPPQMYWKGINSVPAISSFETGNTRFVNNFDTSWGGIWSGWGYSALNDTSDISYATNELGCAAGKGNNQSSKYGVAYNSYSGMENKIIFNWKSFPLGFYITNTTIAYKAMRDGNMFSKKFGGSTGNDADYYRVKFTGWNNGVPLADTVTVYLADFRDTNNSNDYILNQWTWANMSVLGNCDSLTYSFESSDTSNGFINTPLYFCLDDMMLFSTGINENSISEVAHIYPNPIQNELNISNISEQKMYADITDISGKKIFKGSIDKNGVLQVSTQSWSKGIYMLHLQINDKLYSQKLVK